MPVQAKWGRSESVGAGAGWDRSGPVPRRDRKKVFWEFSEKISLTRLVILVLIFLVITKSNKHKKFQKADP